MPAVPALSVASPCALIAATAVTNAVPLHTRNPDDFKGIEGLSVYAV
jgi:predicted nucleic acid-binding protein